jgi:DHA1 family tetracycline resistance protein-like MFS transporter
MDLRKEHLVIFLILVTEVMGFSLVLPFLPLYAQELGASPLVVGLIFTSFSFFQLISAPIMGRLSDHYGRKPLLMISQFSTFIGFMILGFADTLALIFLSRIVDGMFGSNFTISQAYLSDISSKKDRSKAFGIAGAAFGFGFLVGPGIGGYLAQFSYSLPSFLAAGVSLLTVLMTLVLLPETVKDRKPFRLDIKIFDTDQFRRYLSDREISSRLLPYFSFILAHVVFVSMMALFAERQLGLGPAFIGYLLMYVGINAIILRGVVLPKLIDICGEKRLRNIAVTSTIIGLIATAFVTEFWMLLVTMTLFSFGAGTTRPLLAGEISRQVSGKEQGALLGVSDSMGSFAQIIGPLVGGFMMTYFFPGSMALVAAAVMVAGFVIIIRRWEAAEGKRFPC